MDSELQDAADRRFADALQATGARDPREHYRKLLRELKTRDETAYTEAVAEYEESVVSRIAKGEVDPLECWLAFGVRLAARLHPGRTVVLDESGRAGGYSPPPSWRSLILQLPDEARARAVPIGLPPELTPAQRAVVDLLVLGKVKLPEE